MANFDSAWLLGSLLSDDGKPFNPVDLSNTSLLFWQVIVFAILFFLLAWKVWGPLMNTIKKREDKIRGDIEAAEAARKEAEEVRAKHRREMEQAQLTAKGVLDEAEARAAKLKTELETQARTEAESILAKARTQIQAEKAQAIQDIRDQVVDLSVEITRRLLEREVGREDHSKEADRLLAKIRNN